ncbi:hypothetical protein P5673_018635, partial [Acropora cervicornis]
MVDSKDNIHCAFLMGKSRLAHLKPMTVPRLELLAAVLSLQLNKTLNKIDILDRFHMRCPSFTRIPHPTSGDMLLKSRAIPSATNTGALAVQEVKTAEKEIFKHVQRNSFSDLVKTLQRLDQSQSPCQLTSELKNLKTPKSMRKLHLVLGNDGILRVGGRLENAPVEFETKHPIILPYRHHVTDLIILQHHQRAGHFGQEYILASLHQLYWIING